MARLEIWAPGNLKMIRQRAWAGAVGVEEDVQLMDCARWLAAASGFAIKGQER